jgi:hypothetical protein
MQREGCQWSLLCPRDEARSLYTRLGWQSLPHHYYSGVVDAAAHENAYFVRAYDPRKEIDGWMRLAAVYEQFNVARPLTMIRDHHYWQGYTAWMLDDWISHHRAHILVATRTPTDHDLAGYIVVHFYDQAYAQHYFSSPPWFYISEIGTKTEDSQAIGVLLSAAGRRALQLGMAYGQLGLPHQPEIDTALASLLAQTLERHTRSGKLMMRALSPADQPGLEAASTNPTAHFWEIDHY